jgi:hypothetical protein
MHFLLSKISHLLTSYFLLIGKEYCFAGLTSGFYSTTSCFSGIYTTTCFLSGFLSSTGYKFSALTFFTSITGDIFSLASIYIALGSWDLIYPILPHILIASFFVSFNST